MSEILTIEDCLQEKNEVKIEDYYSIGKEIYDKFDEYAKKKGNGYEVPNFPIFNEKLEGMEEGLYVFAGESNSGKTAIVTNLIWNIATNPNNKLFGIYYSLDDSTNEVIPRLIAMNNEIPISVASKPKRYEDFLEKTKYTEDTEELSIRNQYTDFLDKRNRGLQQLRD